MNGQRGAMPIHLCMHARRMRQFGPTSLGNVLHLTYINGLNTLEH